MDIYESCLNIDQLFNDKSKPHTTYFYGPLMYLLCKQISAKFIVEIGLGLGYCSYWLGMAAKEAGGTYFGIDIRKDLADKVDKKMTEMEIPHKVFVHDSRELDEAWIRTNIRRVDFAYLDGNHTQEAIENEVKIIYPMLSFAGNGYIFIHDTQSKSRKGFWKVVNNPDYQFEWMRINQNAGMGILRKVEI